MLQFVCGDRNKRFNFYMYQLSVNCMLCDMLGIRNFETHTDKGGAKNRLYMVSLLYLPDVQCLLQLIRIAYTLKDKSTQIIQHIWTLMFSQKLSKKYWNIKNNCYHPLVILIKMNERVNRKSPALHSCNLFDIAFIYAMIKMLPLLVMTLSAGTYWICLDWIRVEYLS